MMPEHAGDPAAPLPSQRTAVAPYPWLRRYMGIIGTLAPILGGFAAWAEGHLLEGMKPREALKQLGIPTAVALGAVAFVVYLLAVWVPQRDALREQARQRSLDDAREREERAAQERVLLMEAHAADRVAWLATQQEQTAALVEIAAQMKHFGQRLTTLERTVRDRREETTDPAAPSAMGRSV